jgi:hypothetical protein
VPGIPKALGGLFPGFTWNFNVELSAIPIPAAFWLFSSGLIGLIGFATRK